MEKDHLRIIKTQQSEMGNVNKKFLITKSMIQHLESDEWKIAKFKSGNDYSTIVFENEEKEKYTFEIDLNVDMLMIDFDGFDMTEKQRIKASILLEKIVESIRFIHRDKFWNFSYYFIKGFEEYEKRLKENFLIVHEEEWKKIIKRSRLEPIDDYLLYGLENENMDDVHDLCLRITGSDGILFCQYMKSKGLITFEEITDNEYEIVFLEKEPELVNINRKLIVSRELAKYGYNIWVDYYEEK